MTTTKPRPMIEKFVRYCIHKNVIHKKKVVKNSGISFTQRLTGGRMECLNKESDNFIFFSENNLFDLKHMGTLRYHNRETKLYIFGFFVYFYAF